MWKKAEELSVAEQYIAYKCQVLKRHEWVTNRGSAGEYLPSTEILHQRPASNVRRLLDHRRKHQKYAGLKEIFDAITAGQRFESFNEFSNMYSRFRELDKSQGYIIENYIEACAAVEGKSDEQIKMMMLVEGLK